MHLSLEVSQQLNQTITTELMQHLEILQFSLNELDKYIVEKANENPLLQVEDSKKNHWEKAMLDLATVSNLINGQGMYTDNQLDYIQTRVAQKENIETNLIEQIPMNQNLSTLDIKVLKYLINSLDERLFLDVETDEISKKFNITHEHADALIDLLQTFEPIGVGARGYKEYLLIQIDWDLTAPRFAEQFVKYDLENVATQSINQLRKKYCIAKEEIQETIRYIRNLKPKPIVGDKFEPTQYIIPDVEVIKFENEWTIKINRNYLPNVSINETYANLLKSDSLNKEFYRSNIKNAQILIQGIEQRDKTLFKLVNLLLEKQLNFFEIGMKALQPMRLKDIAEILEVHESTVSRAIRNKYIRTPRGVFALQSLFTKGLVNKSGKMDSVLYIKRRIKELIQKEDHNNPLTDKQITEILVEEGIQISRRTIAKYREELNILNSSKRITL